MDEAKDSSRDPRSPLERERNAKFQLWSIMAFIVVTLVVGLPMWWFTTTVYRFRLPSDDIRALSDKPIRTALTISIFTFQGPRGKLLIEELNAAFKEHDIWQISFKQLPTKKEYLELQTAAILEAELLKQHTQAPGDFMFMEWPKLQDEEVLLTSTRSALMRSDTTSKKLALVINHCTLQVQRVRQILADDIQRSIKREPPQLAYDVLVSVLNPAPNSMQVKWHVRQAVDAYLMPFFAHISNISEYTVKTQWKYFVGIKKKLRQVPDSTRLGRHFALDESKLPYVITSVEGALGAGLSKPNIHLVVYVPPCNSAPIHIDPSPSNKQVENASVISSNAFISPKWGGFIIANPPPEICLVNGSNPMVASFQLKNKDVMQVMLYQLYKLTDILADITITGVNRVDLEDLVPHTWEYEAFMRRSAIMRVSTATKTLQSLIHLLDRINYIVINDDVGQRILDAYEFIVKTKAALLANELHNATAYAKRAYELSDRAFFDETLVAQLYFPDEQKYAIYVPLFLPVLFPVFFSLSAIRTFFTEIFKRKKD